MYSYSSRAQSINDDVMSNDHEGPVSDSEVAASGKSKPSLSRSRKLRIKIKLPYKRSSEGEQMEDDRLMRNTRYGAEVDQDEQVCTLCGKGFRSRKALGGHMRVHAQREMIRSDDELRKTDVNLAAYISSERDDDAAVLHHRKPVCPICQRNFPSIKALFGHMRCHPERKWRGFQPPAYSSSSTVLYVQEARSSWDKSEHDDVIDDDGDGNHDVMIMDSEKRVRIDLEKDLLNFGWGAKSRRGRKASLKSIEAAGVVQSLIMLSRGGVDSNSATIDQLETEKRHHQVPAGTGVRDSTNFLTKLKFWGAKALTAESRVRHHVDHGSGSREEGRGNKRKNSEVFTAAGLTNSLNKDIKFADNDQEEGADGMIKSAPLQLTMTDEADVMKSLKDGLMQKKTHVNNDINKRMNKVRKYLMINDLKSESAKYLPHSPPLKPQSHQVNMEVSHEERYKCITCNKSFFSHQALGGHKSSHNKNAFRSDDPSQENISINKDDAGASHNSLARLMVVGPPPIHPLHQCNVCSKIYPTGQALGGHKRIHSSSLISKVPPLPQPPQPQSSSMITLKPVLSAVEPLRPPPSINIREPVEEAASPPPPPPVRRASGNAHGSFKVDLNELPPLEDDEDHNAPNPTS